MITLRGTVEETLFSDSSGWVAARFRGAQGTFRVVGVLGWVQPGETWTLEGTWEAHKEHGGQFRARRGEPVVPNDPDELVALLSGELFPGVGTATAGQVVQQYGDDLWNILEHEPERLQKDGYITPLKARLISRAMEPLRSRWALYRFLAEHNLSPRLASPLVSLYQGEAVEAIRQQPYRLLPFLPWDKVDTIAKQLGVEQDDPLRIHAAFEECLHTSLAEGHTAMPRHLLAVACSRLVGLPAQRVEQVLDATRLTRLKVGGTELLQLPGIASQEATVAEAIARLSATPEPLATREWVSAWLDQYEQTICRKLDSEQREAVHMAVYSRLLVLTGGPGTGKTTVVDAIRRVLADLGQGIEMAAPTGRAARRMQQATGQTTKTLHRSFRYSQRQFTFERREDIDTLIVDESSMVELRLWGCVSLATGVKSRLILVGDSAQLPPVGPGRVLHDLVDGAGSVPVMELKTIHRQASDNPISHVAATIRRGEIPGLPMWKHQLHGVYLIPQADEAKGAQWCIRLAAEALPRAGIPLDEVQVLCPRRGGKAGTQQLNALMRTFLGKKDHSDAIPFAIGDRVIQVQNDYDLGPDGVMNGTAGVVTDVRENGVSVDFDGEGIDVSGAALSNLEHAYGITVHKSQGSQYKAVVIPLYASAGLLLNRAMLYTAITRATDVVIILGTADVLAQAVSNASSSQRLTGFPQHLREALSQVQSVPSTPTTVQQRLII